MTDHADGASNVFQAILIEGHVGVSLFFVLSGFLITLRYVDRFIERTINIADYVRKRIARIFPLYLVVLILTLLLNQEPLFVPENLIAFTLTQGFFGDYQQAFVPTAWSLTVEETFYFVAPLVFLTMGYAFHRVANSSRAQIIWTIGLLLLWTAGLYAIGRAIVSLSFRTGLSDVGGFMANTSVLEIATLFGAFYAFAFGMLGAMLYRAGWIPQLWKREKGVWWSALLAMIAIMGIAFSLWWMNQIRYSLNMTLPASVLASFFGAIGIIALTNEQMLLSRILSWRIFVYLGRISYALYLIQLTPIAIFPFVGWLEQEYFLYIPVLYIGMNVISALLYEFVEKPGRTLVLRMTERFVD